MAGVVVVVVSALLPPVTAAVAAVAHREPAPLSAALCVVAVSRLAVLRC